MFLCKHVLTSGPDQSPSCHLCLFLNTVIFSVLDSLFDLGLFKAGSGSKWKPMIKNLQDFFYELNLLERIFNGELLYSLRDSLMGGRVYLFRFTPFMSG